MRLKRSFIAEWKGRRIYFVMFVNDLNIAHHKSYHIDGTTLKKFGEMKRRCGSNGRMSLAVSTFLFVYANTKAKTRIRKHECNCYVNAPAYRISLSRSSRGTTTTSKQSQLGAQCSLQPCRQRKGISTFLGTSGMYALYATPHIS